MGTVDLTLISGQLFVVGALFFLVIGSFFSIGILRLFQQKVKQGILFFFLAVVIAIIFVILLNVKYL